MQFILGRFPCVLSIEIWKSVNVHLGIISITPLYLAISVFAL